MRKEQIEVGRHYTASVSGKIAVVRIESVSPHGGWEARNTATGRAVRIYTAGRLRARALTVEESRELRANKHFVVGNEHGYMALFRERWVSPYRRGARLLFAA